MNLQSLHISVSLMLNTLGSKHLPYSILNNIPLLIISLSQHYKQNHDTNNQPET